MHGGSANLFGGHEEVGSFLSLPESAPTPYPYLNFHSRGGNKVDLGIKARSVFIISHSKDQVYFFNRLFGGRL